MSLSFQPLALQALSFKRLAFKAVRFGLESLGIKFTSEIPDNGYTYSRGSAGTGYDPEEQRVLDFSTDEPRFHTDVGKSWPSEASKGGFASDSAVNPEIYAKLENGIFTNYPFTMGGWFYKDSASVTRCWVTLANSSSPNYFFIVGVSTLGYPELLGDGTASESIVHSESISDEWVHVVAVYASATSRSLYVNGVLSGTDTASVSITGIDSTGIGYRQRSSESFYIGVYRDIRFYSSALSPTDIADWHAGSPPAGAEAVYLCDEGKGSFLNDSSGNGHHMQVYGVDGNAMLYDDTGLADGDLKGLLMEREVTNHSEDSGLSGISSNRLSLAYDSSGHIGGVDRLIATETAETGTHRLYSNFSSPSGTDRVVYVLAHESSNREYIGLRTGASGQTATVYFSTENWSYAGSAADGGVVVGHGSKPLSGGWYLLWASFSGTGGSFVFFYGSNVTNVVEPSYLGDVTKKIVLTCPGFTAGAYYSSLIRTTGSTVTRSGDLLRVTADTSPWSSLKDEKGTITAEIELHGTDAISGDERYIVDLGGPKLYVADDGTLTATDGTNTVTGGQITGRQRHSIAWTWGDGRQQLALDGFTGADGVWNDPSLGATFGIACDAATNDNQLDGYIRNVAPSGIAKSAAQLIKLTAFADPTEHDVLVDLPTGATYTRGSTGTTESVE